MSKVFTCPKVEYRNTGISATVMAKAWMIGIPSACLNDISEMKLPKSYGSPKLRSRLTEPSFLLQGQPAQGLLMNHHSTSTPGLEPHTGLL